ncbi:MAG: methyltransferase domain-containing protein [Chloroflexota bacterium]
MPDDRSLIDNLRGRLRKIAFESLYGPFAWAYDWVSSTFFLGQWRLWQRASIPHLAGTRILEVGMGTGNLQIDLTRAGFEPFGIDLSPQILRQAARKARRLGLPPFRAARARAQSLPFPNAMFDSVISTFPSDYISDPVTLAELWRVMRPGGRLVVVLGGWLTTSGGKGKAMEGVARVVYGNHSAPDVQSDEAVAQLARQGTGLHKAISALTSRMAEADFTPTARIAANNRGACLLVIGEKEA